VLCEMGGPFNVGEGWPMIESRTRQKFSALLRRHIGRHCAVPADLGRGTLL
jgi:hypothetical protein